MSQPVSGDMAMRRLGTRLLCPAVLLSCLILTRLASAQVADMMAQPIDVASQSQLFIDDRFLDTARGVELVVNPPRKMGRWWCIAKLGVNRVHGNNDSSEMCGSVGPRRRTRGPPRIAQQ